MHNNYHKMPISCIEEYKYSRRCFPDNVLGLKKEKVKDKNKNSLQCFLNEQ